MDRAGSHSGGKRSWSSRASWRSDDEGERPVRRPSFSEGDLLARRFSVQRFIAAGGMGEVYEAVDLELGERIALKTIRPDVAREPSFVERFRREIHLSRQVTHPNVCRVFDLFHHETEPGSDVLFLTMELLEGISLETRLSRTGPIRREEALGLIRQLASALDAAHRAGIVHRDFKPANVVLVPSPASPGGTRAVVTDFGLARSQNRVPRDEALSERGLLIGSAAYMAPEQAEGRPVSAATDIYALGLVVYEMSTGVLPHTGDGPVALLANRLHNAPRPPRDHEPGLPQSWDSAILRCLERDPRLRFATCQDFVEALSEQGSQTEAPKRRVSRAAVWGGVAIVLSVLVSASVVLAFIRGPKTAASWLLPGGRQLTQRRVVAVLGFRNLSSRPEVSWISTALSEMLTTELASGGSLRLVPGEDVARMKFEAALPDSESYGAATLAQVRRNLGNELLVLGSYFASETGTIRLDLRVQETASGETAVSLTEEGTQDELPALVSRLGSQLRRALGTGTLAKPEAEALRASFPSNQKAVRLHAEGLQHLRMFEVQAALDDLQEAVEADPRSPLIRSSLAEAFSRLGYGLKAREEARQALELSAGLGREDRLLVEARFAEMSSDWGRAARAYGTLHQAFPDQADTSLRYAWAMASSGKPAEGLEIVSALRSRSSELAGDPRLDLLEAEIHEMTSDYERARVAARHAVEKARTRGARLLAAPASLRLAIAQSRIGERDDALRLFEVARKVYAEAKDRRGVASVLGELAFVLGQDGRLLEAKRQWEEALLTSRALGDRQGEGRALRGLGILSHNHGDMSRARASFEQAVAVSAEVGDRPREVSSRNNLAVVLREQGALASAEEELAIAQKLLDESQQKSKRFPAYNLGEVRAAGGDLEGARHLFAESLASFEGTGERRGIAYNLAGLAAVLFETGDLDASRRTGERALAMWEEIGERWSSAPTRVLLARVALAQNRTLDARTLAAKAAEDSQRQEALSNESVARAVLAEVLASAKESQASAAEIRRVEALQPEIDHPRASLLSQIRVARARILLGEPRTAGAALERAAGEAQKFGFAVLDLEARLLLAEMRFFEGRPAEARALASALETRARQRGFFRLAAAAARLASRRR